MNRKATVKRKTDVTSKSEVSPNIYGGRKLNKNIDAFVGYNKGVYGGLKLNLGRK